LKGHKGGVKKNANPKNGKHSATQGIKKRKGQNKKEVQPPKRKEIEGKRQAKKMQMTSFIFQTGKTKNQESVVIRGEKGGETALQKADRDRGKKKGFCGAYVKDNRTIDPLNTETLLKTFLRVLMYALGEKMLIQQPGTNKKTKNRNTLG